MGGGRGGIIATTREEQKRDAKRRMREERTHEVTAAVDEGHGELVLVHVVHVVSRREHLRLVNVVDANRFQDLRFHLTCVRASACSPQTRVLDTFIHSASVNACRRLATGVLQFGLHCNALSVCGQHSSHCIAQQQKRAVD